MRSNILILAVLLVVAVPMAHSAPLTLDFETPATGKSLPAGALITTSGAISLADGKIFHVDSSTGSGNALFSVGSVWTAIHFDFDVLSIGLDYSGWGAGVFTAEVYDAESALLDSYHDSSTSGSGFEGSILLAGAGIRMLRFADEPLGGDKALVDNLTITPASIPEPGTLLLLGLGLAGIGAVRRRRKLTQA